jgi:hypothetical protein
MINLAPMCDARHFHFSALVINGVYHAVIADADASQVSSANAIFAVAGSGVCAKRLDFG